MTRNFKLLIGISLAVTIIVGVGAFWFGGLHAKQAISIKQVHVAQLGNAMQQDDFYSTYGNSALVFTAKVSSAKHTGNLTRITFATSRPYSVSCEFPINSSLRSGQSISVIAPGGSATREKAGVLLHNCVQN